MINLFIFFFLAQAASAQKLPIGQNKTDTHQKRQGEWFIWMDIKWNPTNDSSAVYFYRHIIYQDDKPVGLVTDYYKNGAKQYEGILIQDRPEEIQNGIQTWYYPSGKIRVVEKFDKGKSQSQKIYLRSGQPANENWIEDYYRKGEKFNDEKNYLAAATEFLKALENAEAFNARESEEYAAVADWLGIIYTLSAQYDKAIPYQEEYIAVRKAIHAPPDTLMMSVLKDVGTSYRMQENFTMAKKKLREYVVLNAQYFNGNHPDAATAIQTLGTVCEKLHEYNDALTYLTDARVMLETDLVKYEYAHLSNVLVLSGLYLTIGDFAKGEKYLLEEIPKIKAKYGRQSDYYRTALSLLARIHVGAAKYALAEKEWREALDLIRSAEGDQSENYAQTLASLAELHVVIGDITTADQLIRQAFKIFQTKNVLSFSYLEFLSKLSAVYGYMGNIPALLQISEKRKEAAAKLYGSQSVEYARTLLALVDIAFMNRDWNRCEELIKEAVAIYAKIDFQTLSEIEKTNLALLKSRLGTIYLMRHFSKPEPVKLAAAGQYLKEAIAIFDNLPEKIFSVNITDTYMAYATVEEYEGRPQQADRLYDFVYNNVRRQWGETHPYLINVLFLIAKKSEIRKNYKASFENYNKAIALHQKYIQQVFPYLSEIEKEQFYDLNKDMISGFYGFAAQYSGQLPGLAEAWCNLVLDQKGIVLHSFNPIREAIFHSGDSEIKKIFTHWQETKNKYGRLLQNEHADPEEVQKLYSSINDLEKKLAEHTRLLNTNLKYATTNRQKVQQALKTDEAAVEIVYAVSDRETGADSAYYAIVIKPGWEEPQVVRLADSHLADGKSFRFYKNSIQFQQEDTSSYRFYYKPLEKILTDVHTVYWSADGIYHQVNIATLFNPKTKKYLVEEKLIRHVPSTAWVARSQNKQIQLTQPVFFAHPNYGSTSVAKQTGISRSFDLDNVVDLPGTEVELNELTELMKSNQITFKAFEGEQATEEALKKINSPQVLHVATHGYFLPSLKTNEKFINPLLRSGLLMANCQKRPQLQNAASEDGVLTAYEASTLPLYKTALVVLSACETGLGEVKNGEGVYGLQRAFFMAGARQLLMSLWKVDDQATQLFMVTFYTEWLKNKNIGLAFYQTQMVVKEKYPSPHYWGAFVLNGN